MNHIKGLFKCLILGIHRIEYKTAQGFVCVYCGKSKAEIRKWERS